MVNIPGYFKKTQTFDNKNRYFFEKFGDRASIQIPKNKEAKFLYTYSDEYKRETPFWVQALVKECEVGLKRMKGMRGKEESDQFIQEKEDKSLNIQVVIKGVIKTKEQRQWVEELIRSGFDVF